MVRLTPSSLSSRYEPCERKEKMVEQVPRPGFTQSKIHLQ